MDGYRVRLLELSYSPLSVSHSLAALGHLGRWMDREGLDVDQLDQRDRLPLPTDVGDALVHYLMLRGRRDLGTSMRMPWQWVMPSSRQDRWVPACDLFARGDDLVVRMELPGIDPEKDVQVSVHDGVLCVSGERRRDAATEHVGYWRREAAYGAFERGIPLPEGAKAEDITASYDNGVLEVVIPKAAEAPQPMPIPVHAGNGRKAVAAGDAKS